MKEKILFNEFMFPSDLVADIRRANPWWEGNPLPPLPETRRHLVKLIRRRLEKKLAPVIVLRGPRQIGKTTALLQLIEDFLREGMEPRRILRVQFDELPSLERISKNEPILRIVEWYEKNILRKTLNEAARENKGATIFLDEIQNLDRWGPQLKNLVDSSGVSAVVTGSSALRLEMGRDSLAGRISSIEAGVLSLTEIGEFFGHPVGEPYLKENGLEVLSQKEFWLNLCEHGKSVASGRDEAFRRFSERGGYPFCHKNREASWSDLSAQLNETVIQRVIQHDLRLGEKGRKRDSGLLEELFRMACRYTGQSPNLNILAREAQRALSANVGPQRIHSYLQFLANSLLIRLVQPMEVRLKKRKGAPKICLIDHGLRASWLSEIVPLDPPSLELEPHLTVLAGRIAESIVGATLSTVGGLGVFYSPERGIEPEIDFVVTVGVYRVPVEVKYQRKIDPFADTEGLRAFIEKRENRAAFGILVTQTDAVKVDDPRIVMLPLSTFLLLR